MRPERLFAIWRCTNSSGTAVESRSSNSGVARREEQVAVVVLEPVAGNVQ